MIIFRLVFLPVALAFEFDVFGSVLNNLTVSRNLQCKKESLDLIDGLKNGSAWAVRMWDSSAKSPSGWLFGDQAQFGNFDECLSTVATFPVQYCLGRVKINRKFSSDVWKQVHIESRVLISREYFYAGLCIPGSCGVEDFDSDQSSWNVDFQKEFCTQVEVEKKTTWGEICFWSVTGVLVISCLVATICDVFFKISGWKLMDCLSLRRNFKHLIAPAANPDHPLAILHGLRVAAVILVLYAHRLGIPFSFSAFNHELWEKNLQSLVFRFSAQADMTVDTFFVLSGILMGFFSGPLNMVFAIMNRIFRLSPVYFREYYKKRAAISLLTGCRKKH